MYVVVVVVAVKLIPLLCAQCSISNFSFRVLINALGQRLKIHRTIKASIIGDIMID